jgi:ATP-binding cassette subfamily B protein
MPVESPRGLSIPSFLWSAIKPYKWWYLLMLQAPICSAAYPLFYNYAVKLLIDLFSQETHISYDQALLPIAWFMSAQLALDLPWRLNNFAAWRAVPYVFQNITDQTFNYISHHSYQFFQNNLSGSIVSKIKSIGDKYFKMHSAIEYHVTNPLFTVIFSGLGLLFVSKQLFSIVILFSIINIPLSIYFCIHLSRLEQAKQDSWHVLFGTIADRITNIFTLFSFASRQRETQTIRNFYRDVHLPLQFAWHRYDFIACVIWSILYWIFLVSLFIYMIYLRNRGEINVGDIAFTMSLTYAFAQNVWRVTVSMKDFIEDYAAFKSAFSILSMPQDTIDEPQVKTLSVSAGEIRFVNLSFQYEKGPAIFNKLNLDIKSHEKVGIVGHSGAGKSSLISLLLKHFLAQSGDILIDEQSIYSVSADSIRAQISVIPQDILLFHRTIAENIGYAKENATPAEIEQVAKMANIHDFILTLPEGYNTLVGERGVKLSGGQRQRIAIARAILKNAPILILDEATSSLDSQTEEQIQKSINTMLETNQATVIAIAHRLSTIKHMDRIIVMESGQIVEEGSFSTLLQDEKGKFRALWDHQANGLIQ